MNIGSLHTSLRGTVIKVVSLSERQYFISLSLSLQNAPLANQEMKNMHGAYFPCLIDRKQRLACSRQTSELTHQVIHHAFLIVLNLVACFFVVLILTLDIFSKFLRVKNDEIVLLVGLLCRG